MHPERLLAVTLGDPFSINCQAVADLCGLWEKAAYPVLLIGSRAQADDQWRRLGLTLPHYPDFNPENPVPQSGIHFWDIAADIPFAPAETLDRAQRGLMARRALEALDKLQSNGRLAVLTCPIDKAACGEAGFRFPGQTEFFEKLWQASGIMVLAGSRLKVGLVTNHVALENVAGLITKDRVEQKLKVFVSTLQQAFGIAAPRVAVCGLNPHCSDHGLFGSQEENIIAPAIKAMSALLPKASLSGPLPADTVFHRALQGEFDGVLAMYHDQGLGSLKTVHFYDAINITGGLKHLRVSPDHGPARDLFLSDRARFDSFRLAAKSCHHYLT